jgi:hypothetical protein
MAFACMQSSYQPEGPLVILLMVFQSSHGWRRQIEPLAQAGYGSWRLTSAYNRATSREKLSAYRMTCKIGGGIDG